MKVLLKMNLSPDKWVKKHSKVNMHLNYNTLYLIALSWN